MPDKMKTPISAKDFFPLTYYYTAVRIVLKYPLLIGVLPSIAINSFASMGEPACFSLLQRNLALNACCAVFLALWLCELSCWSDVDLRCLWFLRPGLGCVLCLAALCQAWALSLGTR